MTLALPAYSWTPSPNYSPRGGQRVRLVVAHDCEGSYAGLISWFAQARSQVSAHVVLSEDSARDANGRLGQQGLARLFRQFVLRRHRSRRLFCQGARRAGMAGFGEPRCVPLIVDGIEGPATTSAISSFQRHKGLFVDCVARPSTIAALEAAFG